MLLSMQWRGCMGGTKCTMYCFYAMHMYKCTYCIFWKRANKIYKRNLANVGMAGWRHWLTKYTNKESTFHNIATFRTTYIQVAAHQLTQINIQSLLWKDGCLECIKECCGMCFPCLCTLSASATFQPSLHLLDFFLHVEILKFLVHLNTCMYM